MKSVSCDVYGCTDADTYLCTCPQCDPQDIVTRHVACDAHRSIVNERHKDVFGQEANFSKLASLAELAKSAAPVTATPAKRPSWDEYFMTLARTAATRSTCDRLAVGCILVRDRNPLATGYNGAARGMPHCATNDHGRRPEDPPGCRQVVHAEVNAVAIAARTGVGIEGATAYVTHRPCFGCYSVLVNAGVVEVVYGEDYRPDPRVADYAVTLGVPVRRIGCATARFFVTLRKNVAYVRIDGGDGADHEEMWRPTDGHWAAGVPSIPLTLGGRASIAAALAARSATMGPYEVQDSHDFYAEVEENPS